MNTLLPLNQKPLSRRDAADLLRGLAELIESYPTETVVLTIDIQTGTASTGPSKPKTRKHGS